MPRSTPPAGSAPAPVFGAVVTLPHGRHRLSREEVAASQRERLLAAVTDLVAESGYATLTITAIARRARVAPNRFYEHFRGREDCFLAAYDAFAAALLTRMAGVMPPATTGWQGLIRGILDTYLRTLDAEPACARAFLVESDGAGPQARRRRREGLEVFAALLRARHEAMRREDPALAPLPDLTYLGFVHAVRALVGDSLERHPERPLVELAPDIVAWLTATVLGAGRTAVEPETA